MIGSDIDVAFYIGLLGGGGAERVVTTLANEFSRRGLSVLVAADYAVEGEYPLSRSIEKVYLDKAGSQGGFLARNARRVSGLRKACKERRIQNLICFMAEPNFRGLVATRKIPTHVFLSVRNDPSKEYSGRGLAVAKKAFQRADGVVFQTHDAQAVFPREVRKRSRIIMNPVGDAFYDAVPTYSSQRIVAAGRLAPQKNFPMLIEAFSKVSASFPDASIEIYGEGSERESLQALIEEKGLKRRVKLMGRSSDMPSVLSSAGIFVMSSDFEGMPNALMEAQAAGLPTISTDCPCGGPRELVEDGVNGLLVSVGDSSSLALALSQLLAEPEFRYRIGSAARLSASRYRTTSVATEWLDFMGEGRDAALWH